MPALALGQTRSTRGFQAVHLGYEANFSEPLPQRKGVLSRGRWLATAVPEPLSKLVSAGISYLQPSKSCIAAEGRAESLGCGEVLAVQNSSTPLFSAFPSGAAPLPPRSQNAP